MGFLSRHLYCRMLDNGQVETQQIKDIQEDIDNYIENSQEPDFYENEYIYDDISGLDAMLLDVSSDCEMLTEIISSVSLRLELRSRRAWRPARRPAAPTRCPGAAR